MVQFLNADGTKVRPWNTTEEMDEALIERHNKLVKPNDRVIHLGDATINRKALPTIARLHGKKTLVMGNHDVFRLEEYAQYFEKLKGSIEMHDFILSHIPVHESQMHRWNGCIHGHLHSNRVMKHVGVAEDGESEEFMIDPRYLCVSMEHINYAPITFEDAKLLWNAQQ
jgi:calcineurin-like phosphoesterase family protein